MRKTDVSAWGARTGQASPYINDIWYPISGGTGDPLLSLEPAGMCYDDVLDKEIQRHAMRAVIFKRMIIGRGIDKA